MDADDLDVLVDGQDATLDTTGDDGATTGDREDVLDGHEERLVDVTLGLRDGLVDRVHEPMTDWPHSASPSSALSAETLTTGTSSPGNS